MCAFGGIIVWNYMLAPLGTWLAAMVDGPIFPTLEPVPEMWELLKIGIGGYIGGRSVEKLADIYMAKK